MQERKLITFRTERSQAALRLAMLGLMFVLLLIVGLVTGQPIA